MGETRTIRTTVVIPAWDAYAGPDLMAAVASLRDQAVPVRLLVVDNASQVPLPVLPGVSVVRSKARLSLGAARNLGLAKVSTPYVISWDADDTMLPGTLASLEEGIRDGSGLVAFGEAILEPSGARHRWPRPWIAQLVRRRRLFALLDSVWSMFPTTGATIMDSEAVRAAGGYADSDSGEDWCLGASLAFRGTFGWSERPGRVYRVRDDTMWARHRTMRHQFRHAATVRSRLRNDGLIPHWARRLLPVVGVAQWVAIIAHELAQRSRRIAS